MKLVLAIVNNDDSAVASSALTKKGFFVTKLSTQGGFLLVGNTTFLIGTENERVDEVLDILKQYCSTRKQLNPSVQSFGRGLGDNSEASEVKVGGATAFVLSVDDFKKI